MWEIWSILEIIVAVLILICAWILLYDSNRFVVREHVFRDSRIRKSFRAVVLADLHNKKYGRENAFLLEAIREAKPDMILVAGDLLTAKPGASLDTALRLLEGLRESGYPVYYGNGNHEYRLKLYPEVYGDMAARYAQELNRLGITPLVNAHQILAEYGVVIYGLELDKQYYERFHRISMEDGHLRTVLGSVDPDSYSILLAHNPEYFPEYANWGADLTLSGHLHGGMVRVPFWGKGIVSPSFRLFPKYDGGRFDEKGHAMVVSRGLGMHTIPIRLFNPAELLVLDFEPSSRNLFQILS